MRRKPHPYYDIRMDKVKLVSNTRIYLDVNALLDEILDITPNFPRAYKYTIGGGAIGAVIIYIIMCMI